MNLEIAYIHVPTANTIHPYPCMWRNDITMHIIHKSVCICILQVTHQWNKYGSANNENVIESRCYSVPRSIKWVVEMPVPSGFAALAPVAAWKSTTRTLAISGEISNRFDFPVGVASRNQRKNACGSNWRPALLFVALEPKIGLDLVAVSCWSDMKGV